MEVKMKKELSEMEYEKFKKTLKEIGGEDILKGIEIMEKQGIPYAEKGELKDFEFNAENTKVVKVKK
jgi:hypothetical protein